MCTASHGHQICTTPVALLHKLSQAGRQMLTASPGRIEILHQEMANTSAKWPGIPMLLLLLSLLVLTLKP